MEIKPEAPRKILVITDGRAGNEVQAVSLAQAVRSRVSGATSQVLRADIAQWMQPLPPAILHRLGLGVSSLGSSCLKTVDRFDPDLIVGAGRRVAAGVAGISRRSGCAAVQLMDPKMALGAFHSLIVPAHDELSAPNVLTTIGALTQLNSETLRSEAAEWQDKLPAYGLGVLIGGPSKSAPFPEAEQDRFVSALIRLAEAHSLLITPSRRSPERLLLNLRNHLPKNKEHFFWDGSGENPYRAIMGSSEAFLVTADSVNMATEVASTGKPLHVFELPNLAPKLQRFHDSLAQRGASRPFVGEIEAWDYEPLAEADRAAEWLIERLGWA
ncbi:MAG: mitochondrial fission ELM1 family protein [Pseudomonadota bacterium]